MIKKKKQIILWHQKERMKLVQTDIIPQVAIELEITLFSSIMNSIRDTKKNSN